MKKRALPILLILVMLFSICSANAAKQTAPAPNASVPSDAASLTLYADFSHGTVEEKQIIMPTEGEPASRSLIAFALADGLTEWTGLDFTLNDISFPDEESVIVDWSKDSTLIAGIGEREFKEGFHFFDAVSLNWFMMDSLATTLKRNLKITTVYYQSDAQPVTFKNPEDMAAQGLPVLPIDQAYEGSAFFLAHAGGRGEDDTTPGDGNQDGDQLIAEGVFTNSLLKSDPGDNMTPYEAASGLFNLVLKEKLVPGTDYSVEQPMFITCVDVTNIDGEECYLFSVSGAFNTKAWEYAVSYNADKLNVYLVTETGNQLLGSLLDLGQGDRIAD